MFANLTPVVLTYNEAPNIGRLLDSLRWGAQIVVVDSVSTDKTEEIARGFDNVMFTQRVFEQHAAQWNFGIAQTCTDWVLALDADYSLPDDFVDELRKLVPSDNVSAYFARFRYCIAGRTLRGTLYPPRAVLFRKSRCRYVQDGHTQILEINGATEMLNSYLLHDDRKPLTRWLDSQRKYAELEAREFIERPRERRSTADRLRRCIWPAAPAAFFYTLLVKGCLFDGWPGWFYALQRTYAELLLSLHLLDHRLGK